MIVNSCLCFSFLQHIEQTFTLCSQLIVTAVEELSCPPRSDFCHRYRVRWQMVLNSKAGVFAPRLILASRARPPAHPLARPPARPPART